MIARMPWLGLLLAALLGAAQANETPLTPGEVPGLIAQLDEALPAFTAENSDAAEAVTQRLAAVKARLAGEQPFPKRSSPAVHVFACYESEGDRVKIRLADTAGPVVLILSAYESVWWTVEVAEGVDLQKVVVTGYENQTLETPESVGRAEVVLRSYELDGEAPELYASDDEPGSRAAALAAAKALGGSAPATFQQDYDPGKTVVEIGPGSQLWRTHALLPELEALRELLLGAKRQALLESLSECTFTAVVDGQVRAYQGTRTAQVLGTAPQTWQAKHAVTTPEGTFLVVDENLYRVHTKGLQAIPFVKQPGRSEFSPLGVTYDPGTKRLLMSCDRVGLYAYDPGTQAWVVVTADEDGHMSWGSICLSPDGKTLWMLPEHGAGRGLRVLTRAGDGFTIDAERRVQFSRALPISSGDHQTQLVPLGDRVGVVVTTFSHPQRPSTPPRLWVVEQSGQVLGSFPLE